MTNKILKATHQGELDINGFKISCAVLENGERVLVNRSLANAFGIKGSGAYWQKKKEQKGAALPEYLSAKYLQPFITEEHKLTLYNTVSYINKSGIETEGVDATFLSDICDIYVKAGEKGAFKNSPDIPKNAYNLLLALSKVAITALVDEVTGYQNEREKDELQKLLKLYIAPELLPWSKTFPDTFYMEIFRLNGWDFTVNSIKKRPGVVGLWTNKLIYEQLPKGVLKELKTKTPKSEAGNYKARFFQSLTEDIGNPHLQQQLNSIITLMQISDNWKDFIDKFNKLIARKNGQLELKLHDLEYKPEKDLPLIETKSTSSPELILSGDEEFDTAINKALKKGFPPKGK